MRSVYAGLSLGFLLAHFILQAYVGDTAIAPVLEMGTLSTEARSELCTPRGRVAQPLSTVSRPCGGCVRFSTSHSPSEERRRKGKLPDEQAEPEGLQASRSFHWRGYSGLGEKTYVDWPRPARVFYNRGAGA